jgi:hypothetical protein
MPEHEDFARKLIRQFIGEPTKPTTKFTYPDIIASRDKAIKLFCEYPYRARIEGMLVDLSDSDKRALAFFEASVEVLNRLGVLDEVKLERVMPRVFTEVQEVNTEQTYGASFTPQKK